MLSETVQPVEKLGRPLRMVVERKALPFIIASKTQILPSGSVNARAHDAAKDLLTSQEAPLEQLSK